MAYDITSIQQLIEERAEKKFDQDFSTQTKAIKESRLFNQMDEPPLFDAADNNKQLKAKWAFDKDYSMYRNLKAYWLPIYISEESKAFFENVERLQADVNDLLSNQPRNDY